jgi:hypothetical protein
LHRDWVQSSQQAEFSGLQTGETTMIEFLLEMLSNPRNGWGFLSRRF